MKTKYLITALSLLAFSAPALAATDYYVVKNAATKKCEVTSVKPDGKSMMEVGKKFYKTKDEATDAMKTASACK